MWLVLLVFSSSVVFAIFHNFWTLITPSGALKHYPILFHGPLKGLVVR